MTADLNKWSFGRCHGTHLLEMRRIYVRHFSLTLCGRGNTLNGPRKNIRRDIRAGPRRAAICARVDDGREASASLAEIAVRYL